MRVPNSNLRTPDYEIFVPHRKVIVEIKELCPNKKEHDAQRRVINHEFVVVSTTPGQRVRKKISDADQQIKIRSKGRFPGLLVLMDAGFLAKHTSAYNIRVAMYGFEALELAVPSDPRRSPELKGSRFGGNRRMTPTSNTSISAIAIIGELGDQIDFRVYHNAHAAIPLKASAFSRYGVPQYVLVPSSPGVVPDWVQV